MWKPARKRKQPKSNSMTYSIKQESGEQWLIPEGKLKEPVKPRKEGNDSLVDFNFATAQYFKNLEAYESEQKSLSLQKIKAEGEFKKREGLVENVDFVFMTKPTYDEENPYIDVAVALPLKFNEVKPIAICGEKEKEEERQEDLWDRVINLVHGNLIDVKSEREDTINDLKNLFTITRNK